MGLNTAIFGLSPFDEIMSLWERAKYTDGTASDIQSGHTRRGIAPFNAKNSKFSRKKGSVDHHKTDRDVKIKKSHGNGIDHKAAQRSATRWCNGQASLASPQG